MCHEKYLPRPYQSKINEIIWESKSLHIKVSFPKHQNNDAYFGPIKTLKALFVYKRVYEHKKTIYIKTNLFFPHYIRLLLSQGMQVVKVNHGISVQF